MTDGGLVPHLFGVIRQNEGSLDQAEEEKERCRQNLQKHRHHLWRIIIIHRFILLERGILPEAIVKNRRRRHGRRRPIWTPHCEWRHMILMTLRVIQRHLHNTIR